MNLLNDFDNAVQDLTGNQTGNQNFQDNGFIVAGVPQADGNGLPSQKLSASNMRHGKFTRHVAHWFVPEVGVIPMFINPQSMSQTHNKLINKERTKGGFIIQYWGEDLMTMNIEGHTGSSGVEGLNVLYEIYRAEQYMFDSIALTMAADSSISGIGDLVDGALGNIGGFAGSLADGLGGALGAITGTGTSSLPSDVPSLAAMATGIELYYAGWVFRGYFQGMTITERVDALGFFNYTIQFVVTQRRGYRTNFLPWQRSPFIAPTEADPGYRSFGFDSSASG